VNATDKSVAFEVCGAINDQKAPRDIHLCSRYGDTGASRRVLAGKRVVLLHQLRATYHILHASMIPCCLVPLQQTPSQHSWPQSALVPTNQRALGYTHGVAFATSPSDKRQRSRHPWSRFIINGHAKIRRWCAMDLRSEPPFYQQRPVQTERGTSEDTVPTYRKQGQAWFIILFPESGEGRSTTVSVDRIMSGRPV